MYSCDESCYLIHRAIFRARIRDFIMCKHSVSTRFITSVATFAGACVHEAAVFVGFMRKFVLGTG